MTLNKQEDKELFKYYQELKKYNEEASSFAKARPLSSGKYERGSLMQLIFDPFVGAQRLDNGALFYEVMDKELDPSL